jgi:hypothetical protein
MTTLAKSDRGDCVTAEAKRPGSANRWTREENDRLYELFQAGVPYAAMAAELGRSVDAVKGKFKAWGLRRQRAQHVTAAELQYLISTGMTRKEAAERVGICDKYARNLLWKAANA